MLILVFYVPVDHAEFVKSAIFAAGGGKMGNYDRCSWECLGAGQFRPLPGAHPFLGRVGENGSTPGEVERVAELRVEMVVESDVAFAVQDALVRAHPYETPAFHFIPVSSPKGVVLGAPHG